MALIKCPECKNQVSSEAEVCVHCGYRIKKRGIRVDILSSPLCYTIAVIAWIINWLIIVENKDAGIICCVIYTLFGVIPVFNSRDTKYLGVKILIALVFIGFIIGFAVNDWSW